MSRSAVVRAVQTVLSRERPLNVDGRWGPITDQAYTSVAGRTRMIADEAVKDAGWDVNRLRPTVTVSHEEFASRARAAGIRGSSLVNLMATVQAETGFRVLWESHVYSNPASARRLFSVLRPMSDAEIAQLVASGPVRFFERVYGPGAPRAQTLGNTTPGDGARFAGAGLIQLTGRSNFTEFQRSTGHPVLSDQSLLRRPDVAADTAIWFWNNRVVPRGAQNDMVQATRVVNSGLPAAKVQERLALLPRFQRFA